MKQKTLRANQSKETKEGSGSLQTERESDNLFHFRCKQVPHCASPTCDTSTSLCADKNKAKSRNLNSSSPADQQEIQQVAAHASTSDKAPSPSHIAMYMLPVQSSAYKIHVQLCSCFSVGNLEDIQTCLQLQYCECISGGSRSLSAETCGP
jgi:hypothetical protein